MRVELHELEKWYFILLLNTEKLNDAMEKQHGKFIHIFLLSIFDYYVH